MLKSKAVQPDPIVEVVDGRKKVTDYLATSAAEPVERLEPPTELARRREIVQRNDKNLARYMRKPEAQARFRLRLSIRAALGLP